MASISSRKAMFGALGMASLWTFGGIIGSRGETYESVGEPHIRGLGKSQIS